MGLDTVAVGEVVSSSYLGVLLDNRVAADTAGEDIGHRLPADLGGEESRQSVVGKETELANKGW